MNLLNLSRTLFSPASEGVVGGGCVRPSTADSALPPRETEPHLNDTALRIKFQVLKLIEAGERQQLKDLAAMLDMSTSNLTLYRAKYPELESLVRAALPLSAKEKMELKLAEYEALFAKEPDSVIINGKQLCEAAGVSNSRLIQEKNLDPEFAARVDGFVRKIRMHQQQRLYRRVEATLSQFEDEHRDYADIDIAKAVGLNVDEFVRLKRVNAPLAERINNSVSEVPYRRFKYAIDQLNQSGVEIKQERIAEFLDMSPAAVNYYKTRNSKVADLLADAIPMSARERVRRTIAALQAEGLPINRTIVSKKAGTDPNVVYKVLIFNPEFKALVPKADRLVYASKSAAEAELKVRIAKYGSERSNSATVLDQSLDRGGNRTLLKACRRFGIELPVFQYERYTWLTSYVKALAAAKPIEETEARELWQKAKDDNTARNELFMRLRPLVRSAIETGLKEEFDPAGFKLELLEVLVEKGDGILLEFIQDPEQGTSIVAAAARKLREQLWSARDNFYKQKNFERFRQMSMDAPMTGPGSKSRDSGDNFTLADRLPSSKSSATPEICFADEMLSLDSSAETESLISKRDAATGLAILSPLDKQTLTSGLRKLFNQKEMLAVFDSDAIQSTAAYMTGALGRLGSAVRNHSSAEIVIVLDAVEFSAKLAMEKLAKLFNGRVSEDGLSCYVATGAKSDAADSQHKGIFAPRSYSQKFLGMLQQYELSAGTDGTILNIKFVTTDQLKKENADRISSVAEVLFGMLKNGINIFESESGGQRALAAKIVKSVSASEELAQHLLDFTAEFLVQQREKIEELKENLPG